MRAALLLFACTLTANAQWQILDGHTTADLRGIDNVGNGIAWASGSNGTVLRTEDNGKTWQHCATPPDADKLDFRGIQAFDANTAIVMSSGKGDLSRLYKTTDGCRTWVLLSKNPDKEGFWDALIMSDSNNGWLLGDPVEGTFVVEQTMEHGAKYIALPRSPDWKRSGIYAHLESEGRGAFAASNSSLAIQTAIPKDRCTCPRLWFGTSGPSGAKIFRLQRIAPQCTDWGTDVWMSADVSIAGASASSGVFSIASKDENVVVAVGGDYVKPNSDEATAAYSKDGGNSWRASILRPHGYRSAVAYDAAIKTWITVGPNGTDISTDDGRNWRTLRPGAGDAADADQHWNALSLPFVVGPKGRIGVLEPQALKAK